MLLLPLRTRLLEEGDDLVAVLTQAHTFAPNDILVISSKAIAMTEGAMIDLHELTPSSDALSYAKESMSDARFIEAVLRETSRMHGRVRGTYRGGLLTELRPDGPKHGTILIPNAGLDRSNVPSDHAIGWPLDPVRSLKKLRETLEHHVHPLALIVSDSACRMGRKGVTAIALCSAGIDPIHSRIGEDDLFRKPLQVTVEARADQLATAANMLMGNAAESIPTVIIRDHGMELSDFEGWVKGMEPEEDFFRDVMREYDVAKGMVSP